jgi:hypothetical protein
MRLSLTLLSEMITMGANQGDVGQLGLYMHSISDLANAIRADLGLETFEEMPDVSTEG